MVPPEQSTTTDAARSLRLRSWNGSRSQHFGRSLVGGVNKRSVLGLLTLAVGLAAAATPDGIALGILLVVAGAYLLSYPLIRARGLW